MPQNFQQNRQQQLNRLRARHSARPNRGQATPLPWSGRYESTVGQANRQYNFDTANYAAQEQNIRKAYGFDDTSDPFSRQRMLKQSFDNANRGTLNNYAASGHLYSGSLNNARDIDRNNYEQSLDATRKEYQAALDELAQRRMQAQLSRDEDVLNAQAERLSDAVAERADPYEAARGRRGRRGRSRRR